MIRSLHLRPPPRLSPSSKWETPMVRALGAAYVEGSVLPQTRLGRLLRPAEIAEAICFLLSNSAVSGELWADAGWRPPA